VAITRGAGPIGWSDGSGSGTIRPPQVDAVDTLGAGDIFHGAFCHYLARGSTFVAALEQAARIAALSCTRPGTRAWIEEVGG
jgi:sugar/nucleoside kinase (ribokinase family)